MEKQGVQKENCRPVAEPNEPSSSLETRMKPTSTEKSPKLSRPRAPKKSRAERLQQAHQPHPPTPSSHRTHTRTPRTAQPVRALPRHGVVRPGGVSAGFNSAPAAQQQVRTSSPNHPMSRVSGSNLHDGMEREGERRTDGRCWDEEDHARATGRDEDQGRDDPHASA